jgi:hypothetical protein
VVDNRTTIIDMAILADRNIKDKETEKVTKYQDLIIEIQKLWNVKAKLVPVVGESGVVWENRASIS